VRVIYDLQQELQGVAPGPFTQAGPVLVREMPLANAKIEQIEDVKTICIYHRAEIQTGIDIRLDSIPDLAAGDRITVTGRVGPQKNTGGKTWSVALIASYPEDGQITQHTSPDPIFAVSHILEEEQLDLTLYVHTVFWGAHLPLMDLFIDSVLVTRFEKPDEADTRDVVYALAPYEGEEFMGSEEAAVRGKNAPFVFCAGYPHLRALRHGDDIAIHVGNRFNDWDGVDINLARMGLRTGNQYKIAVRGRVDGKAPKDATIMLQGIPGFVWKKTTALSTDAEFAFEYVLSRSEVEKWHTVRITTNTQGSSVAFFICGIEIRRME